MLVTTIGSGPTLFLFLYIRCVILSLNLVKRFLWRVNGGSECSAFSSLSTGFLVEGLHKCWLVFNLGVVFQILINLWMSLVLRQQGSGFLEVSVLVSGLCSMFSSIWTRSCITLIGFLLSVSYPHLSFGFIVELFLVKFQCCVVMMFLGVQSTGFSGLSGKKLWSFSLIVLGS